MKHCTNIAALSAEEKDALRARIRAENPDLYECIVACTKLFPGSRVSYVKLGDDEWGERPDVEFPALYSPRPERTQRRKGQSTNRRRT